MPPRKEQSRIVKAISERKVVEKGFSIDLKQCRQIGSILKDSILSRAFSGRLVPQDPSEGTGHQLLEQILAAKSESNTAQEKSKNTQSRPKARKPKK